MQKLLLLLGSVVLLLQVANIGAARDTRIIYFENKCAESIWVGGWALNRNGQQLAKFFPELTGFEMATQTRRSFVVPSPFISARFWPRTGCRWISEPWNTGSDSGAQKFHCESGDCGNPVNRYGVQCGSITGEPPTTLAELTIQNGANDFYDLSNVDGHNVGMKIEVLGPARPAGILEKEFDCGSASCSMDTNKCPVELTSIGNNGRKLCFSICKALYSHDQRAKHAILQKLWTQKTTRTDRGLQGLMKDLLCCQCGNNEGTCENLNSPCTYGCSPYVVTYTDPRYKTRVCPNLAAPGDDLPNWPPASNGMNYAQVFTAQCKDTYSWQFNDQRSTYQCKEADYKITFCPS